MELLSFKTEDYILTRKAFSKTSNLMINNGYLINNKLNSPKRQWISPTNKSNKTNRTTITSRKMNKIIINLFIKYIPPEIAKKMALNKIKGWQARQRYIDALRLKKLHNLQIRYQVLRWCLFFHSNLVDILIKDKARIFFNNKLYEIAWPCIQEEDKNSDISSSNISQSFLVQLLLSIRLKFMTTAVILHIYQQVIIVNYHILSFFCNSADLEVILKMSKSLGLFRPTDWKVGSLN